MSKLRNLYEKDPFHYFSIRMRVDDELKIEIKGLYNKIFLLLSQGTSTSDGKKKNQIIHDENGCPISPELSVQLASIKTIEIMKKLDDILSDTVNLIMPMEFKKNES